MRRSVVKLPRLNLRFDTSLLGCVCSDWRRGPRVKVHRHGAHVSGERCGKAGYHEQFESKTKHQHDQWESFSPVRRGGRSSGIWRRRVRPGGVLWCRPELWGQRYGIFCNFTALEGHTLGKRAVFSTIVGVTSEVVYSMIMSTVHTYRSARGTGIYRQRFTCSTCCHVRLNTIK